MKNELTKEEMRLLLGGVVLSWGSTEDVNNNNKVEYCYCTYNNAAQVINNNNHTGTCRCYCENTNPIKSSLSI